MKVKYEGLFEIEEQDFNPTQFLSKNNKEIKISTVCGESSSCDISSVNGYESNMQRSKKKTLYIYRFIYDETPLLDREIFKTLGELSSADITLTDICYILSQQRNKNWLDKIETNRFFLWNEEKFFLTTIDIDWKEWEPSYVDRHSGFPYIETPASPEGWSIYLRNTINRRSYKDVVVFSSSKI